MSNQLVESSELLSSIATLNKLPIWTHSRTIEVFDKKLNEMVLKDKIPVVSVNDPSSAVTRRIATGRMNKQADSKHVGIILSQDIPIIVIDVDVDPTGQKKHSTETIPDQVISFLEEHPTHAHLSPSGHGVHIIYRLSEDDANILRNANYKKNPQTSDDAPFKGDILWSNAYLIMTDAPVSEIPYSESVAEIALSSIYELCPSTSQQVLSRQSTPESGSAGLSTTSNLIALNTGMTIQQTDVPNLAEIRSTLPKIPPTINRYVERAYAGLNWPTQPSSYDHWLTMCFALAHAAIRAGAYDNSINECYQIFDAWSQLDVDGYVSPEDTWSKWEMCVKSTMEKMQANPSDPTIISYKLIFKLANLCCPQYPILDFKTSAVVPNALDNVAVLLEFHDIHIIPDSFAVSDMYVLYPKDAAPFVEPRENKENFRNDTLKYKLNGRWYQAKPVNNHTLELVLVRIAQRSGFPMSVSKQGKLLGITAYERMPSQDYSQFALNKFTMWVDSKPWDGKSRVTELLDTLHFHDNTTEEEHEHYHQVLRKVLLWMVGVHYYDSLGHTRGTYTEYPCMPILFGPEHTYKSTWIKHLMSGSPLGTGAVKEVSSDLMNNDVEFSRVTVVSSILLVDECELALKKVSEFKNKITRQHDTNRGMYRDGYKNYPRRCAIFGTSNAQTIFTSRDGNRRLFVIRIKHCDTTTLAKIDKQQLYAELKSEFITHTKAGNIAPWNLTKAEIAMNNKNAEGRAAKSNVDIVIRETFGEPDFEISDYIGERGGFAGYNKLNKEGRIISAAKMTKLLHQKYAFSLGMKFNINEVEHALRSYCKKYTGTNETMSILIGKMPVYNGCINVGGTDQYLIPEEIKELSSMAEQQEGE